MKLRTLGMFAMASLIAVSVYASDNDSLEQGDPDVEKARRWLQERSERRDECEILRQLEAEARRASHDENDPRPRNDRLREQLRYRQEIETKCANQ